MAYCSRAVALFQRVCNRRLCTIACPNGIVLLVTPMYYTISSSIVKKIAIGSRTSAIFLCFCCCCCCCCCAMAVHGNTFLLWRLSLIFPSHSPLLWRQLLSLREYSDENFTICNGF